MHAQGLGKVFLLGNLFRDSVLPKQAVGLFEVQPSVLQHCFMALNSM